MLFRVLSLIALGSLVALGQQATVARGALNELSLKSYVVEVKANESFATTVVSEIFYNPGARIAEADFFFPLAAGAAPSGLQLSMGGKFYGGNLLTRERAGTIYREITRRRRDPALLDCVGKDLYRCRIWPVPAHGNAAIKFSYRQPLVSDGEMRRLVVPLDASRFSRRPVEHCAVRIRIETEHALQAILSPTHEVRIRREGVRAATVTLAAQNAFLARDLVLLYSVDRSPMGAVIASTKRPGKRGYFVLSIDAAFAREKQRLAPRDVVLAVDTSNSAGRNGVDSAAAALSRAVEDLRPGDRYALMSFGTEPRLLRDFEPCGESAPEDIREVLSRHPVAGKTLLVSAMTEAAEVARRGRPGTGIILLTDGQSVEGIDATLSAAEAIATKGNRIGFCGVGTEIDTTQLDAIGDKGRGDSSYAVSGRGLAGSVRELLESTRAVPLTDVRIAIEGVSELYPRKLRVLRQGDSLIVAGRYARGGPVTVHLAGKVGGERVTREFTVELRERGGDPAVARLWAARRVGYLLDRSRGDKVPGHRKAEILRLGRQHGIVTPYTSMLVLEGADQKRFLKGMRRRPLLSSGGGILVQRGTVTREFTPEAELAERIKRLRHCRSGDVRAFADLLGSNRMRMREAAGRTFYRSENGRWVESELVDLEPSEVKVVRFLSKEWEQLVTGSEEAARICSIGSSILFRLDDGTAVKVVE